MMFVGMGTNLPLSDERSGRDVLEGALKSMAQRGLQITGISRFYKSEPVPASDQDWYVNAVASIGSPLGPVGVLRILHEIEDDFERVRTVRNAARTLDLDLLAYDEIQRVETDAPPHLPHPRMADRAFVLLPLYDVCPIWCHPVTGASLSELIANLPTNQRIEPLED